MTMMPKRAQVLNVAGPDGCLEQATEFNVVARRNLLLALWAGQKLGLEGDRLDRYAREVLAVEAATPGQERVIARLRQDFAGQGLTIGEAEIRAQLRQATSTAFDHFAHTD